MAIFYLFSTRFYPKPCTIEKVEPDSLWGNRGLRASLRGTKVKSVFRPQDLNWQPSDHGYSILTYINHTPVEDVVILFGDWSVDYTHSD